MRGLRTFANTILKMKTVNKGSIETLRLAISTYRTEDSHHFKCSLVSLGLYRLKFPKYPPLPEQFSEKNLLTFNQ